MHRNVKYKNGTNINPGLTPISLLGTLAWPNPGLQNPSWPFRNFVIIT